MLSVCPNSGDRCSGDGETGVQWVLTTAVTVVSTLATMRGRLWKIILQTEHYSDSDGNNLIRSEIIRIVR